MIALVYPELYGVQGIARYIDSFLKNLPENHPKIYVITGDKSDVVSREYTDRIEIINIPYILIVIWKLYSLLLPQTD